MLKYKLFWILPQPCFCLLRFSIRAACSSPGLSLWFRHVNYSYNMNTFSKYKWRAVVSTEPCFVVSFFVFSSLRPHVPAVAVRSCPSTQRPGNLSLVWLVSSNALLTFHWTKSKLFASIFQGPVSVEFFDHTKDNVYNVDKTLIQCWHCGRAVKAID